MTTDIKQILAQAQQAASFLGITVEQALIMAAGNTVQAAPQQQMLPAIVQQAPRGSVNPDGKIKSDRLTDEEFISYKFIDNPVVRVQDALAVEGFLSFDQTLEIFRRKNRQLRSVYRPRALRLMLEILSREASIVVDRDSGVIREAVEL